METTVKLNNNLDHLSEIQREAVIKTGEAIGEAINWFTDYPRHTDLSSLKDVTIIFSDSLKGVAGRAYILQNKLIYNNNMLEENGDDFIGDTIPHEVSHLIADKISSRRESSHGLTWKWIMQNIYNLTPTVHHNYNPQSSVKSKRYEYFCLCGTNFYISKGIHNKICNGSLRYCRKCNTPIIYIGE